MSGHDDNWFLTPADGVELPKAHGDKANPVVLIVAWAATTITVFAVVAVVVMFFSYTSTRLREDRVETTAMHAEHIAYKERVLSGLEQTAWVNAEEGVVQIGLDRAMSEVVESYAD